MNKQLGLENKYLQLYLKFKRIVFEFLLQKSVLLNLYFILIIMKPTANFYVRSNYNLLSIISNSDMN